MVHVVCHSMTPSAALPYYAADIAVCYNALLLQQCTGFRQRFYCNLYLLKSTPSTVTLLFCDYYRGLHNWCDSSAQRQLTVRKLCQVLSVIAVKSVDSAHQPMADMPPDLDVLGLRGVGFTSVGSKV